MSVSSVSNALSPLYATKNDQTSKKEDISAGKEQPAAHGTSSGSLSFADFEKAFNEGNLKLADVGSQGGVAGSDGTLDNNDWVVFVDQFFARRAAEQQATAANPPPPPPPPSIDTISYDDFQNAFNAGNVVIADVGSQGGVRGADGVLDNNDLVVFNDIFFSRNRPPVAPAAPTTPSAVQTSVAAPTVAEKAETAPQTTVKKEIAAQSEKEAPVQIITAGDAFLKAKLAYGEQNHYSKKQEADLLKLFMG